MPLKTANRPFEIDQSAIYREFITTARHDIAQYLTDLQRTRTSVIVFPGNRENQFPSTILSVDEATNQFTLDCPSQLSIPQNESNNSYTLEAMHDGILFQFRFSSLSNELTADASALTATFPNGMLRLQRREFFRLRHLVSSTLNVTLARPEGSATTERIEADVTDISAGGISLKIDERSTEGLFEGQIFNECRLVIPAEAPIIIKLMICSIRKFSTSDGKSYALLGCKYVSPDMSRLGKIERYIARIEREQIAKGLQPS